MRQARDRQRESIALSGSNPGKSVANIFRHRSSSKRGHELPPLLNDNKVFLSDDTDKAELFSDFFAKHLATESDPVPFVRSLSDRTLSTIDVSSDLIKKHINQRLDDLAYWRGELDKKLQDNAEESRKLRECIVRLQKALAATCEPLHIANQCLLVRLNQKSAFNLKRDHVGKQSAFNLDEYGRTVSSYAENIPDAKKEAADFTPSFSPAEWQAFTQNNLEMADKQLQNSHQMRNLIEGILIQVAEDQKKQVADTNWALKKRITEVRDAKGKLEEHLALTLKEISDMEDNIAELKSAIRALSKPAAVTETRQNLRDVRPGIELCRDAPFYRIIEQTTELRQDSKLLHDRLQKAEEALKALCRRQLDLEEEIANKSHTLHIDEVQVAGMRDSILIQQY
ncbi:Tektin 1 [Sparganum proliferum]